MKKIVGASVVWNQMWEKPSVSQPSRNSSSIMVDGEVITITPNSYESNAGGIYRSNMIYGHKILLMADLYADGDTSLQVEFGRASQANRTIASKTWTRVTSITYNSTNQTGNASCNIYMRCNASGWTSGTLKVKNVVEVDLTVMFESTIADYVHTLETSQSGSGIAWLQSYGFFTEDYYAYKQNKLESGCVSAHKTYDGETLLTNTELSPITLRGLFKLSTDKLTVDGDEYNADGSVTRKYGIVDLGSLNWTLGSRDRWTTPDLRNVIKKVESNNQKANIVAEQYETYTTDQLYSDTSLIGIESDIQGSIKVRNGSTTEKPHGKIAYELATPSTEQTTPFTETEIVGSTEEFIDYEVAQSNRDVDIPVGTETDYYQEMKLPSLPTTSGNHNLIYNIASGFGWS